MRVCGGAVVLVWREGWLMRRYAVVGTGARARVHVAAVERYGVLVGLADPNPVRIAAHNRLLAAPVPAYRAADFTTMLAEQSVDVAVVTTVDRHHAHYVVAALEAGCDVITEKPMTTDPEGAAAVADAVARTGRRVDVAFNYRYHPVHERVAGLLAGGVVGRVGSVHFEWFLDVRHGADYFRRWHRDKASSGGLLVHKSTHHFDLVNWWLGAAPVSAYAQGSLFFYGEESGKRHGRHRDYARVHGSPEADGDPFALRLAEDGWLRELYLDAEPEDGYQRDQNPFAPGVTIEDDLAVLVRYDTGASMTYHLTAYSPKEGYRVVFNGDAGRLELEVVETSWVSGQHAAGEPGWVRLTAQPLFGRASELPTEHGGGHHLADQRMTAQLYGPPVPDPLGRRADHADGIRSLLTGFAANRSLATGQPVAVADLL